jgi:hypothetical protein
METGQDGTIGINDNARAKAMPGFGLFFAWSFGLNQNNGGLDVLIDQRRTGGRWRGGGQQFTDRVVDFL